MDFTNKPTNDKPGQAANEAELGASPTQTEEVTPVAAAPAPQAGGSKQTEGKGKSVLKMVFWVLFLLVAAYAAWATLQWQQNNDELSSKQNEITSLQSANAQLTQEHSTMDTADDGMTAASPTAPAPVSDDEQIKAIANAYVRAQKVTGAEPKVLLGAQKNNGTFARVEAGFEGGSGKSLVLKKTDKTWVIVWAETKGVAVPEHVVDQFAIPADFR